MVTKIYGFFCDRFFLRHPLHHYFQGDMRQALNNLQSTKEGFGLVKAENVFKVCDEPHPLMIKDMITHCIKGSLDDAYKIMLQVRKA